MANTPKFAVLYGRTDYFAEEGLSLLFVNSMEEVKDLANQFINVIPDDLDYYQAEIKKWKGTDRLVITHQDDDTFLFSAVPVKASSKADMATFSGFVSEFYHDSGDEEDASEDD